MKRIIATIGLTALSAMAFSQNAFDAMVTSKTDPVLGTARYSGMAGAFTALGGNASAIKDNPAALGIYRSHEITFTPTLYINNDSEVKGALNNFAAIINLGGKKGRTSGYICSSIGINYNRMSNISRYTRRNDSKDFSLTDNIAEMGEENLYNQIAYEVGLIQDDENGSYSVFGSDVVDRELTFMEKGHVGQWDISYGLNIANRVYLGAAFGINSLRYKQTSMYTEYSDTPTDNGTIMNDTWYLDNMCEIEGAGFNFRVGAIVRPVDVLRIGASFETPTYYDIKEYNCIELGDNNNALKEDYDNLPAVYDMRTPLKFKAGLGFVIGKRAMIDLDYQYENWQKVRLTVDDMNYDSEADVAEARLRKTHTLKLGTEVQVLEGFCLRAGVAYQSKPFTDYTTQEASEIANFRALTFPQQSVYVTGGAGYKGEHFYCDLAYAFRNTHNLLYDYLPLNMGDSPLKENLKTRNIIATVGWRF